MIRPVEDFFDKEYRDFALYTITFRALPSVIDGFKPTQRKAAFIADRVWRRGDEKPMKVFQLAGRVAAEAFYHHGNASLESTIIGMAQTFKNSMPIFHGIGQFGSLRVPEAGAPRYVGVKFNENFRLLYKDFELVTPQIEEGEQIEPIFFLPIIPTVLLNGGSGIAVGFATNIMNRNPIDLIDACFDVLNGNEPRELFPWVKGFTGAYSRSPDSDNGWIIKGVYNVKNMSTVEITDIPPSLTYEKYESYLDNLVEKGILTSYDDMSSDKVHYVLKFPRQTLSDIISRNKLEDILKLQDRESENLTTLGPDRKLLIFDKPADIVKFFVDFRLGYYQKRKDFMIKTIGDELDVLSNRARFIKSIVDGSLQVNARAKKLIEDDLAAGGYLQHDGSFTYLTSMPIHSLTKEKMEELLKTVKNKNTELKQIKSATPRDLYSNDLTSLRQSIIKSGVV